MVEEAVPNEHPYVGGKVRATYVQPNSGCSNDRGDAAAGWVAQRAVEQRALPWLAGLQLQKQPLLHT